MLERKVALSEVVEYLNNNKHLLQNEHNKYTVQGLMLMLNSEKLHELEREFNNYPTGLELPIFLFIMKEIFAENCQGDEKYEMVDGLINLFQCIDINGDGHMIWEQFTEYIIQALQKVEKPTTDNKNYMEKEIIENAYSKLGREYKLERTTELNLQSSIKKFYCMHSIGTFFTLQKNTKVIRLYDMDFNEKEQVQFLPKGIKPYHHIQDFAVDEDNMMLGVLMHIGAFFTSVKYKPTGRDILPCEGLQVSGYNNIWYMSCHRYWAFTSSHGQIKIYSIRFKSRIVLQSNQIYYCKQHTQLITMLKQINQPQLICTCSLDGTVKLLSLNSLRTCEFDDVPDRKNSVIDSKQKKGYLGFDFSGEFGRYVLLYGFSNTICLYCLDVSLTKGYAGKYKEHTVSITHAAFVKGYPYVISIDEKCCIRIWNFRTLQTNQMINGDRLFSSQCEMLLVPELDAFYTAERRINEFKSVSFFKKSKEINQYHQPIDFHYNSYLNSIFIFTSNDARQYDSLTGRLKQVITDLSDKKCEFVVTAAQFGPKCRKIYIGDAAGFVREYSTETGQFIRELKPLEDIREYRQIKKILYVKEQDIVICASVDGRILVYLRNDNSEYNLVRDIRGSHTTDLTAVSYSQGYHLLATGCEGGSINLWNSSKYVLQTVFITGPGKIIDINFVKNYPVLLACCERGEILCYGVRPIEQSKRFKCLFKIANDFEIERELSPISSFSVQVRKKSIIAEDCSPEVKSVLLQDTTHTFMAIGQAKGNINVLCLDIPFKQCGINRTEKVQSDEFIHPRRYDYCFVDKLVQSFISRRSLIEARVSAPVISKNKILVKSWQAHHGTIDKVKILKEPLIIMGIGADQKLKIWQINGEVCGIVNCETFKNVYWRLPETNITQKLKQIDFVLYTLKLIDNQEFTEEKKDSIKVKMLMNKFMNEKERQKFYAQLREKEEPIQQIVIPKHHQLCAPLKQGAKQVKQVKTSTIQFQQNYEEIVKRLKDRLENIDKQIKTKKIETKILSQSRHPPIQLTSDPSLDRKKQIDSKEIRLLRAKLEAIDLHTTQDSQSDSQKKKEKQKKSKSSSRKNYLFVSYSQLKRNLAAMHKMLRINNIR